MEKERFTKEESLALKAVAVLLLIIHGTLRFPSYDGHDLNFFPLSESQVNCISEYCKICIGILAFISGYGITKKYHNSQKSLSQQIVSQYRNVMKTFWPVFVLALLGTACISGRPFSVYQADYLPQSILYVLLDGLGLAQLMRTPMLTGSSCYLSAMVVFLVFAPIFRAAVQRLGWVAPCVLLVFIPRLLNVGFPGDIHPASFLMPVLLGVIFAEYNVFELLASVRMSKADRLNRWFRRIAYALVLLLSYKGYHHLPLSQVWEYHYGIAPVVFILCFLEWLPLCSPLKGMLSRLGKHSGNVFFVHDFVLGFGGLLYSVPWFGLIPLVVYLVCFVFSVTLEWIKARFSISVYFVADTDQSRETGKRSHGSIISALLIFLFSWVGVALFFLAPRMEGMDVEMLLFHLFTLNTGEANYSVVYDTIYYIFPHALPFALGVVLLYLLSGPFRCTREKYCLISWKKRTAEMKAISHRWMRYVSTLLTVAVLLGGGALVSRTINLFQYFGAQDDGSAIYRDRYVDPSRVDIQFPAEKRNLIHIVMESMETSWMDQDNGGCWAYNLLPNLTRLQQENANFTRYTPAYCTYWTAGALVAQTAGIPMRHPIEDGYSYESGVALPGAVTLGDILHEQGYQQVFMCGSDANYAGRANYFQQHGDYEIVDYKYAIANEIIPPDYNVFWGFEDCKLYDMAKEKLLSMSQDEQPFNLTLLTVDTHFYDGYLCDLCGNEYDTQYENVLACADQQVGDFVRWIQAQDFYDNTTIVISGDHLYKDNEFLLSRGVDDSERSTVACVINPAGAARPASEERTFTVFDLFPTVLSAIGADWNGNRLGLGVDLFSTEPTLVEEMGFDAFDAELRKSIHYYAERFIYQTPDE